MTRQRKAPRYEVQSSFPVIAHIKQSENKIKKIKTIGSGGLGLVVSNKDARLIRLPQIDLSLIIGSTKLEFQGKVQYCHVVPSLGLGNYFLGIQFHDTDPSVQDLIKKMIDLSVAKGFLRELEATRQSKS